MENEYYLGTIARVDMGFDVRRNREKTLRFCMHVARNFPSMSGIPNLSYNDFEGEENFLFYYNHNRSKAEFFKKVIEKEGLVERISLGVITEHFLVEE